MVKFLETISALRLPSFAEIFEYEANLVWILKIVRGARRAVRENITSYIRGNVHVKKNFGDFCKTER
jgi:hypothetical protein